MTHHLDNRETRDQRQRELDLMGHLPGLLAKALKSPGWQRHLGNIDPTHVNTRAALARLPVMRKARLCLPSARRRSTRTEQRASASTGPRSKACWTRCARKSRRSRTQRAILSRPRSSAIFSWPWSDRTTTRIASSRSCPPTRRRCSASGRARARLRSGRTASLVLWDQEKEVTLSAKSHHMRVDYSPYEGRVAKGAPRMVIARGEVIVDRGAFKGRPGRGTFVKRQPGPPLVA